MLYRTYYTISWYIMCVLFLCVIRCVSTWYLSINRNEKIRKYNIVDRVARREQRPRIGNTVELIKRALPMYP